MTRKSNKQYMFDKLFAAASAVVVNTRGHRHRDKIPNYIIASFHAKCKFEDSFPKGVLLEKDNNVQKRKINAHKLIDWMYDRGYCEHSVKDIVAMSKSFAKLWKKAGDERKQKDENLVQLEITKAEKNFIEKLKRGEKHVPKPK